MRRRIWVLLCLLLGFYLGEATVEEKAEATTPVTTLSPPEGNTTFLDGTTWCVALPGVSQVDLQNALDWACGKGMTDCSPIREGGPCYDPNTLVSHASYAFNAYYQSNGNSDIACNFGGTATLTKHDPSYSRCLYVASTSESLKSAAALTSNPNPNPSSFWLNIAGVLLLLLYMRS